MSLILEALKQSEGDRQEKSGAIGLTAYNQRNTQTRRWLPWVLGIFLIVDALAVGWYFFKETAEKPQAAAAPPAEIPPARKSPPAEKPPAAKLAPKVTASAPLKSVPPKPPEKPEVVKKPLPNRPLSAEIGTVKPPIKPQPLSQQPAKKAEVTATVEKPQETVVEEPNPTQESRSTGVISTPPAKSADSDILRLDDVPDAVRAQLAVYEINAHVYSDEPVKRFALINMQRVVEGNSLGNSGYKVVEILPAGIVVDYGEGKALLPLTQH